jgi:signal transduction histidine kinase/CheY-like chemotaxis protein
MQKPWAYKGKAAQLYGSLGRHQKLNLLLILATLACFLGSRVLFVVLSTDVISGTRGYIQGEARWSKAQKDAVLLLYHYAYSRSEADYDEYIGATRLPLVCRQIRRQLDLPRYDVAAVDRAFAVVGIQPDDRNRMIWIYRRFRSERHIDQAVALWTESDRQFDALLKDAEELHRLVASGGAEKASVERLLSEIYRVNSHLTTLEVSFSNNVAEASTVLQRMLLVGFAIVALLLLIVIATVCVRIFKQIIQSERSALEASHAKTEFLANMSHEIRTPMNGVVGMISLALDRCSDPQQKDQLVVAQVAAHSLITILNDILDLSKIEAGKLTLEEIDFDLQSLFRESLRIFESTTRDKKLRLGLWFSPDCPTWVRGDPVRLRQIVINLVGNALKFTAEGEVDIRVKLLPGELVRLEVRDSGIGIEADKLNAIFEAFTQADGSYTRRFGGSGLGLAITRRVVGLMDGRVWAESQAGHGSCFFVELPLPSRPAPERKETATPASPATVPSHLEVLVAEDNPVNQKVICAMLKRLGWGVTLAANGREAYERFLQMRFDLILMDVQMPEVDGLEATRLVRLHERRANAAGRVPIIALTAHAAQTQHEQCLREGMDGVITKPVDFHRLVGSISGVLTGITPATDALPAYELRARELA